MNTLNTKTNLFKRIIDLEHYTHSKRHYFARRTNRIVYQPRKKIFNMLNLRFFRTGIIGGFLFALITEGEWKYKKAEH